MHAPLLFLELLKIARHAYWTPGEQVIALNNHLERLFLEATKKEQIAFSTLFARISYAGHRYNFQPETLQVVHHFRRLASRVRNGGKAGGREVRLGIKALAETVQILYQTPVPEDVVAYFPMPGEWRFETPDQWEFKASARVVALRDDPENQALTAVDEEEPAREIRVLYGLPERNDNFTPTIKLLRQVFGFPVTLQLHEVDIDGQGRYRPKAIVVEPDYLVDISAVAECFKESGSEPLSYLLKKFLPYTLTPPILLGNIANYFLDRLLHDPQAAYADLFRETFRLYPFAYAPMADGEVRSLSAKAQKHYLTLKNMALGGFARQGIDPSRCMLEPTFYSAAYGLQGRLDLFYRNQNESAIVELKSGQPFRPNAYGIQRSHFTQTLLYDLLVRSVYGAATDPIKYILYSGVDLNPLRFAPTVAPEQWEAIQVRNQLVGVERLLAGIRPGADSVPVFSKLTAFNGNGKGYLKRDMAQFEAVYAGLDPLERKYFNAFAGFIARENILAKTGEPDSDNMNGNAALWRDSFADKQQAFALLSHLEILDNRADKPEASILFRKTDQTNPLANFRVGDIAVLYPASTETDTVLEHQVIKCTVTALQKDTVEVQLRYRQFNLFPFEGETRWNLEPDMLETGFTGMYRSLFEWAGADKAVRRRIMLPEPGDPSPNPSPLANPSPNPSPLGEGDPTPIDLLVDSQEQQTQQTVPLPKGGGARGGVANFYLLWGPPGTGKTSVTLRAMAKNILRQTTDNLLLLAYTNRAVDEICDALDSLGDDIREQYLRIGSQHATAPRFREQMLQQRIAGIESRAELLTVLESRRIVVGTVASFAQNDGLLRLKKFHRLIIDEASQLLEPQLLGLLTRFDHFVLIGDHRQLPAVTGQPGEYTRVSDPDLNAIGLSDLRDSYFERLFKQCVKNNWTHAFGSLYQQGRMHADIMEFPGKHFYDGMLQTLAVENNPQLAAIQYRFPENTSAFEQLLAGRRVLFLPSRPEETLPGQKTSRCEAETVAEIVCFFKKLYAANEKQWNPLHTLGVITPWRAQIAQIRACLLEAGLDPDDVTTDTVERYQGGAREVIIVSCCVHSEHQMASLVSLSAEGVDRKLNVALTRARNHIYLVGNREILEKDERYRDFIFQYAAPPL